MKKVLVAYFSASGVTAKTARLIALAADADLFEIKPVTPYTDKDLDWTDKKSRSSLEMNDPSARPEIAEKLDNFDDYDVVFVGFPVWWYVEPRIIDTFLDSYDFFIWFDIFYGFMIVISNINCRTGIINNIACW